MNRPTRRLATAVLIAFGLLGLIASWVQVVAADTYRLDPRNARFNLAQSGKERGLIVSADGVVLARSDPDPCHHRRLPPGLSRRRRPSPTWSDIRACCSASRAWNSPTPRSCGRAAT